LDLNLPQAVILRSEATLYPVPVGPGQVLTVQDSAKNLVFLGVSHIPWVWVVSAIVLGALEGNGQYDWPSTHSKWEIPVFLGKKRDSSLPMVAQNDLSDRAPFICDCPARCGACITRRMGVAAPL